MNAKVQLLDDALLRPLIAAASRAARRRMNLNLHAAPEDACQRFFNAMEFDSYVPPHRHLAAGKEETLIVIKGALTLCLFNDSGTLQQAKVLRAGADCFGAHVPLNCWHTVLAHKDGCVFFEAKGGPYQAIEPHELASWAPAAGSPEVADYIASLRVLASA
jgi:cupin fold WbuC family metalloprotein